MRDMPNLDLVRSMAVLSVVLEHYLLALNIRQLGPFQVAWVGVLGVMVFFVLTCLVLMWSLERKPHTLDFYIRRFFRIYPLAWLALLVAVLTHAPTGGTADHVFRYDAPSLLALVMQGTLIPGVAESTVSVMWSLPYEIGMYVLLPVLFFFVRRNFVIWPLLLFWALAVETAYRVPSNAHTFLTAIGYFLPGVMAYVAFGRWRPSLPGWLLPFVLAALWIVFWYHANFHHCWAFCLIVGLSLPMFRQITSPFITRPSHIVAKYSYGIYLSHPFAIALGLYVFRSHPVWVRLAISVPALVLVPVVAYHLVEHPLIRLGSRLAKYAERKYEQRALPDLEQAGEVA